MKISLLLAAAALAVAVAPSGAVGSTAGTSAKGVGVNDNFYSPKSLTVNKGTTVQWKWRGSNRHNVKVRTGPVKFNSGTKRSGTFSRTMGTKGTYKIYCSVHPSNMKMTLKVN